MNADIITLESKKTYWAIRVMCPYCGVVHKHGGGTVAENPVLGERSSHCSRGEYVLMITEDSVVKGLPANYFLRH